jgi:Short-chain dehydrogenases of various substrate specificities
MDWYKGKKVFITGGSSGIGKSTALLLAQWGADICIAARDAEKLSKTLVELRSHAKEPGQKMVSISLDVANRTQVKERAAEAVKQLCGIDVLINCAGITWPGYVQDIPDTIWDSMINVDYMGSVNTVRAFLPYFIEQKHGSIANVSSVVGYMGVFGYAAYGPAKFAVVGFSECLRQELLPYNIGVSVIYPPDTDTPGWPEENKLKPQETKVLSGTIKVVRSEFVAMALLKGISRRTFTIIPGAMNKFTYFMNRHLPGIVWMIVSGDLRKYWKKQPSHA